MLSLYKIKCGELEEQVFNLSNMLRLEKESKEEEQALARHLSSEMARINIINNERIDKFNEELKTTAESYKHHYELLSQEKEQYRSKAILGEQTKAEL